jgi:hypothetical protein
VGQPDADAGLKFPAGQHVVVRQDQIQGEGDAFKEADWSEVKPRSKNTSSMKDFNATCFSTQVSLNHGEPDNAEKTFKKFLTKLSDQ